MRGLVLPPCAHLQLLTLSINTTQPQLLQSCSVNSKTLPFSAQHPAATSAAGKLASFKTSKAAACHSLQVDVVEDESTGKRTIKTTSICWGNKLSLLVSMPFYDPHLPPNPNDPDLDFSQAQIELNTEADWQKVCM